jgi:alcohol dehydrogenase class IV
MVKPFHFSRIPVIIFRNGSLADLPDLINSYGKSILVVTGERSFAETSRATSLFSRLRSENILWKNVIIPGEPSPEMIDNVVAEINAEKTDLVVAIGGGSVMDAGKALSAMIHKKESVTEFLEGVGTKVHPGTKIPFIAIPTTAGTGSEVTKNAVISRVGENGFKRSLRHDNFVPDIALVDPDLTLSCPPYLTAASGMDCFTQLTEAFLSLQAKEYTDALALEGLKAIKSSLIKSFLNGEDTEARAGMSFAALTSGICLANAGLGAVHGFASAIGGMYSIPHGIICGTLMAVANEINVRELRKRSSNLIALKKYTVLGKLFIEKQRKSDEYYVDAFIEYLYDLTDNLNLPGLKASGVEERNIELICSLTDSKNNPVKLSAEELREVVYKRFI